MLKKEKEIFVEEDVRDVKSKSIVMNSLKTRANHQTDLMFVTKIRKFILKKLLKFFRKLE